MTLPFENDTNSFIKKLASAQLKKERLKKIFTIVAISLATSRTPELDEAWHKNAILETIEYVFPVPAPALT